MPPIVPALGTPRSPEEEIAAPFWRNASLPIEPGKDYVVAGWASVNEGTEGPPVWELVERYVAAQQMVRIAPNSSVKISGA